MSKHTNKRRQMNYKPVLLMAAIAIPLIVIVTVLAWPKPQVPMQLEGEPTFDPHLTKSGNFIVRWKTNLPSRGNMYYRFDENWPYDEIVTGMQQTASVAIPGQAGKTVEFYVEVPVSRGNKPLKSKTYRVALLPATATASGPASVK